MDKVKFIKARFTSTSSNTITGIPDTSVKPAMATNEAIAFGDGYNKGYAAAQAAMLPDRDEAVNVMAKALPYYSSRQSYINAGDCYDALLAHIQRGKI